MELTKDFFQNLNTTPMSELQDTINALREKVRKLEEDKGKLLGVVEQFKNALIVELNKTVERENILKKVKGFIKKHS